MERALLAVVIVAVVVAVAAAVRARQAAPAPTRTGHSVPDQLDRADFARPDAPWLVVEFSSASCLACQGTWEKVAALESGAVAVQDVAYQADRDLHDRYEVDAVPLVLVADAAGVVRASFVGPPSTADLCAAVADARAADPPAP
ncbi:MAG: hypothetical protein M3527_05755 [Actinomycetota bacterium]|nr:hypothetical protein [Actinomycetota bacterium]